ncbi:tetratricopeptide repeat protein [Selenomonas ruminantium]|uniref:tetratricopeptide repeat protein n=1 Tax=Selenomonas ruminantium TaxID=971 RepID=UPI0026F1F9B9|nr:tetratricopeptide repeat protein [Selenomonas ruminantium]
MYNKILTIMVMLSVIFCMPLAEAEVRSYEGVGEYWFGEGETPAMARARAQERAEQNALEQAGVYVESYTTVINNKVEKDEINTIAQGVLKIIGQPQFYPSVEGNGYKIKAVINATVETKDIDEWFKHGSQARDVLITQNRLFKEMNEKQNAQIANLQKQLAETKSSKEKAKIEEKVKTADNEFLANEKVKKGNVLVNKNDYITALMYFEQAIELNPNSASAYYGSAYCYSQMHDYAKERQCLTRAIQIKPNFYQAYYMRGLSWGTEEAMKSRDIHKELDDVMQKNDAWRKRKQEKEEIARRKILDYSCAININPYFAEAYINRGTSYITIKNYNLAVMDLEKGIKLGVNDKVTLNLAKMSLNYAKSLINK